MDASRKQDACMDYPPWPGLPCFHQQKYAFPAKSQGNFLRLLWMVDPGGTWKHLKRLKSNDLRPRFLGVFFCFDQIFFLKKKCHARPQLDDPPFWVRNLGLISPKTFQLPYYVWHKWPENPTNFTNQPVSVFYVQNDASSPICPTHPSRNFVSLRPKPQNLGGLVGGEAEFDPLGFSDTFDVGHSAGLRG